MYFSRKVKKMFPCGNILTGQYQQTLLYAKIRNRIPKPSKKVPSQILQRIRRWQNPGAKAQSLEKTSRGRQSTR